MLIAIDKFLALVAVSIAGRTGQNADCRRMPLSPSHRQSDTACEIQRLNSLCLSLQAADFLSGMGLGMVADQLKELKLGELLDTPPPGLDEAVAIAKVVQFVNSQVRHPRLASVWIAVTCDRFSPS